MLNDAYANVHVVLYEGTQQRDAHSFFLRVCNHSQGRAEFTSLDPTLFILVQGFDSRHDPSSRLSGIQGSITSVTLTIHLWRCCIPLLPYPPFVPIQHPDLIDKIMDFRIQYRPPV